MRVKMAMLGLAVTCLAGCSSAQMYDGPKQPDSAVVKINGMSNWDISAGGLAVKVCKFDGKALDSCLPFIDFMPGTHTLTIELTNLGIKVGDDKDVTQDFIAGEQCSLDVLFSGGGQSPVLTCPRHVDATTKPDGH
jgi:hypothetical protein